jgi:hypothetical protein
MQSHRHILFQHWDKIDGQIESIRAERLDPDLESGHDKMRELEQVRYNYTSALCDIEDVIAQAKRASMYGDIFDEEYEDHDEDEAEELEPKVEQAEGKEDMLEHLPSLPETSPDSSNNQPLDLEVLHHNLVDELEETGKE